MVLHLPHLSQVCLQQLQHLHQHQQWQLWPDHCFNNFTSTLLRFYINSFTWPYKIIKVESENIFNHILKYVLICRDSFHRLSIRSRTLVRSNTMNKEDLEKVKEMNLAKKANTSTSPLAKESRTPQMFRSNTTLDGSIRPLNIRKSSIIARSKVVCRWYKYFWKMSV